MLRGEDKALAITITDSAGTLQNIDNMADLIVVLYSKEDSATALASYRKVAATGYTTLVKVSTTEYTAVVPYTVTDDFPIADLMVEAMVVETDARFPDSQRRTKGFGVIEEVETSIITV